MQRSEQDLESLKELTHKIIGCAYAVGNGLGVGFLEKVYENALAYEIQKDGMKVKQQKEIKVSYDGVVVGEYVADLIVNDVVLIELKVAKAFDDIHMAQCLNYLKATGMRLCLLINFGKPRVEVKRIAN